MSILGSQYCWCLKRDVESAQHKRKSLKGPLKTAQASVMTEHTILVRSSSTLRANIFYAI